MAPIDHMKIAREWVTHTLATRERSEDSPYFEATELVSQLVRDDPEFAWKILEGIRRVNSSDVVLSNLAAGPLEDLLVYHGHDFIDRIEDLALRDPSFRKLLGAVWKNKISDYVWNRLKSVAGPTF